MKSLPEVENAKQLMNEARQWSVMKWLREKKNVRKIADQANAALDELSDRVKQGWPPSLQAAYKSLVCLDTDPPLTRNAREQSSAGQADATRCKQAEDEAYRARALAEETFNRAEEMLSPSLAREGCTRAIRSWELKEKAIRLAENATKSAEV